MFTRQRHQDDRIKIYNQRDGLQASSEQIGPDTIKSTTNGAYTPDADSVNFPENTSPGYDIDESTTQMVPDDAESNSKRRWV
jgi:hypothetical protein